MHDQSAGHADVTEGSGGVWERLDYDWSDPDHVVARTTDSNAWGGRPATPTRSRRNADGTTDIDYVVVREGKNLKGIPRHRPRQRRQEPLVKAFDNSVKAIEAREATGAPTDVAVRS